MNLTSVLKHDAALEDHSLVDHSWWGDTGLSRVDDPILNIDSVRNPNNVKPQLEVEWGLGGPNIDLNEPAGVVKRNIPEEDLGDADAVVLFARDMMNRGLRGRQVVASLRTKYPPALLAKASAGLRDIFSMEGLIGRVMVDARGYPSCREAMKAAMNSPYKRFVKYVFGCSCGDPHLLPAQENSVIGEIKASSGNAFDDFMAGDKSASQFVSHCRSTMMPILASQGDLDKSFLDDTMIEMMNLTPVPESVIRQTQAMSTSNLGKLRAAFRWLDKRLDAAEDAKYAEKVDAGEFKIRRADNELDIFGPPQSEMEIDGTNPSLMTDIESEAAFLTNFDGPNSLPGILDDIEVADRTDRAQVPVELMDGDNPAELGLREETLAPGQLELDERRGDFEVELFDGSQIDVAMDQFMEPEFEKTDEIELDDIARAPDDLPVSMAQNQEIEL
jgi:hypothetical protein